MSHKRKGQLTTSPEWAKHLRKIGKRFFWKGERLAEKKMIEKNMVEFETQTLSEAEIKSAEKLFDYLNQKLSSSVNYEDLHNLYYSLFCTLDILPENLKSLKLTKEVLALTFAKLSTRKNITKLVSNNSITDENYWIEQIAISMTADKRPNLKNVRILLRTK